MTKTLLCDKWEFAKTPIGSVYDDARGWRAVDLPHDWLIYDTKNLYETSTGWYRRRLTHKKDGLRTALRFEGVYMDCRVYVNGLQVREWKNGYTTFDADITDYLREGENLLSVRVDHREPNSRWYSGAGIYRDVWLCRYPETHILADGVYISADEDVTVSVEAERPENETVDGLTVRTAILDEGKLLAESEYPVTAADSSVLPAPIVNKGRKYSVNTVTLKISSPRRWDIDDPKLYDCLVELKKDGAVIDSVTERFGFRHAEFTPDGGFFLNGRHVKLHGACEHHDLGALGAAFNSAAFARKLGKLREMGVNAIRTTHNPPAPGLMELADEMGFLILSEFTDVWEMPKTKYDYARFTKEWREKDIASWVRRDRNHPSLIGWSLGNEIFDTAADEHGQEITSLMRSLVMQSDPRGNAVITIGSNQMRTPGGVKCADILKTAGYNYTEELYELHHRLHPDWRIYGSETSSVVTSRGIYHFPLEQSILSDDDGQCSALGNASPLWAAKSWEACIIPDRDAGYCAGQFIWTGFDYIGEPTPYDSKNSYFGQFDTAGFPKDGAYVYRGAWTDHKKAPFVHIFPYWDFSEGETIDLRVASNAPRVALYFNGTLIKEQTFDREKGRELLLDTKLPYEKGELLAIAFDEDGNELARDVRRSFGDAVSIEAVPDKRELKADGRDLIFIEISALDKDGGFVYNACDRVSVRVSGAGRLIGLDNGDSADYEQYKGLSRRLFSGKLLAIVAAKDRAGEIDVGISSPSLTGTSLKLRALEAKMPEGVSCLEENTERGADCPDAAADIPVRKIELTSESRTFTPERKTISFTKKLYPANAAYTGLDYRVTNVNGITSKLAAIKESGGGGVTLEALGDGEFYLRAYSKNGTDKIRLMSIIRLNAEGLGSAFHDPYAFTEGGLYSLSGGDVSNGIEHGVHFGAAGGWFGIENADFGAVGSDTLTVPIFSGSSDTLHLKIYDGTPESGELIGDLTYKKPSKWLEYQEETYKLTRTLRGLHTISFASEESYDIKGFVFEKRPKETALIPAVCSEGIYGDKFSVGEDAVTGIGNNVTISFGEFDFEAFPPACVYITARSALPKNAVQLVFESAEGGGSERVVCEFEGCAEYTERRFGLSGISGKCKLSLIFLPGCDIDLKSIRFE